MRLAIFILTIGISSVAKGAVIQEEEGLYSSSDAVIILTPKNFDENVYGQNHALLIQFYNSFCGHCRAFAPKFKLFANEVKSWSKVVQIAVFDCSANGNIEYCRQFEVMSYPSLRYFNEKYVKENNNYGQVMPITHDINELKENLVAKLQSEQLDGYLKFAPDLSIKSYNSLESMTENDPDDTLFTFIIFEKIDSVIGSELILDLSGYAHIVARRALGTSPIAKTVGVTSTPAVVSISSTLQPTLLMPSNSVPTRENLLKSINTFLKLKGYDIPKQNEHEDQDVHPKPDEKEQSQEDTVYYADLEKTLKTIIQTEIVKYKVVDGEKLKALLDFLNIIIEVFPFKSDNTHSYFEELRNRLSVKEEYTGTEIYNYIKQLENTYDPVFMSKLEFIGCKGSSPAYRGYSCGLWTLFHTLTVNALRLPGTQGPKVLGAVYGFVKYFFGCTECSQHFQEMAHRNRIFDIRENYKAVLWLWVAHNEVNLRLAGDPTEDPHHVKIQYPSPQNCPTCRRSSGGWNLPAVSGYLQKIYGAENIQTNEKNVATYSSAIPFSNLDMGLLSILYILSFFILILVIKLFITKKYYKKKVYKYERWGKV